jgi:hypothetical protein
MGEFLESYSSVVTLPSFADETLRRLVGVRRLIEIQLALFEMSPGGFCDLEYCLQNVRALVLLGLRAA